MEINVEDYFSEAQIAGIVEDEIRGSIAAKLRDENNVMVVNAIYSAVGKHVDAVIAAEPELQALIVEKTKGVITKLSNYLVFYKPDVWSKRRGEQPSLGQQILEEEVGKRRERIGGRVDKLIRELEYGSVKDLLVSSLSQTFFNHEEDQRGA